MASVTQYFNRHIKVSLSSSAQKLAKGRRHEHFSAVLPYFALKLREEKSPVFASEYLPISYHF